MLDNNSIVQNDYGVLGRVVYNDNIKREVHVIVRLDTFSWKIEKWDPYRCKNVETYLWPMSTPFCNRYQKIHRTPDLRPMAMEIDEFIK